MSHGEEYIFKPILIKMYNKDNTLTCAFLSAGFLNYYDACSEGLRLASPQLKFGGPGGECKKFGLHSYCWALLNHVQNGVSYFTQQTGVRMDFISIHKKVPPTFSLCVLFDKGGLASVDYYGRLREHYSQ